MNSNALVGAMLPLLLAGCAGHARVESSPYLKVVNATELPAPSDRDTAGQERSFLIGPFDRMSVEVYGLPELTRTVQVDSAGRIALPLVGPVMASGLTPGQLEGRIADGLKSYVRNPRPAVNIVEMISQTVTVDGEVAQPGIYPITGKTTLMKAIARAQGATEFAKLSHVVIFRTVAGQRMAALYDLRAIRQGLYPDPEVYTNDLVMVGTNQARRIFRDVLAASPLLSTAVIAILK